MLEVYHCGAGAIMCPGVNEAADFIPLNHAQMDLLNRLKLDKHLKQLNPKKVACDLQFHV